jgi:hypothetical protein
MVRFNALIVIHGPGFHIKLIDICFRRQVCSKWGNVRVRGAKLSYQTPLNHDRHCQNWYDLHIINAQKWL